MQIIFKIITIYGPRELSHCFKTCRVWLFFMKFSILISELETNINDVLLSSGIRESSHGV